MLGRLRNLVVLIAACSLFSSGQTSEKKPQGPKSPSRPDFKPAPEVPAMPKALMKFPRTPISRVKFPAIDFHFHGRELKTVADYQKLVRLMDQTGIGVICNMDAGFGKTFDNNMKLDEPVRDRIVQFARVDFEGINKPGWAAKAAAELDRCFRAGAVGLKINKVLGLDLKNPDGTYIQSDDPRFDPIWEMCARHNKPVMIHTSDSYGRFLPIVRRTSAMRPACGAMTPRAITTRPVSRPPRSSKRRARICTPSIPRPASSTPTWRCCTTTWIRLPPFWTSIPTPTSRSRPAVQDLGRAPLWIRKFFLKYQDRILFGSDGFPERGIEEFWVPHWRFLETFDEYFDHPAQLRSPTGAPLHGRWRIYGIGLPDDVLRKVYYTNALRYLPSVKASIEKQLAARR